VAVNSHICGSDVCHCTLRLYNFFSFATESMWAFWVAELERPTTRELGYFWKDEDLTHKTNSVEHLCKIQGETSPAFEDCSGELPSVYICVSLTASKV
jgi:hypothetical protein